MDYGYKKNIKGTLVEVEKLLRESLLNNGFGVITEIDIKEKLEDKLGVDFREYKILGSCHPPSAYESLNIDLDVGILLPCNFVVWDNKDGSTTVATIKASSLLSVLKNHELKDVGEKVDKLVSSVMNQL
tara:strand:- start:496 stop:882 length:387 start_codon:yes stop_codon:yes gene_type:complete